MIPLPLGAPVLAALFLAACGLAGGAPWREGAGPLPPAAAGSAAPACSVTLDAGRAGTTVTAAVTAGARPMQARWDLRIESTAGGNSASVTQSGDIALPPAGRATLAQADLPAGARPAVRLTVEGTAAPATCTVIRND